MSKQFFDRLTEYYTNVGEVLRGEANAASIFPNASDIGTSRERIYAEMLRSHVPSSCNVVLGGFLFDQEGNESKQLDILIVNESSLRFDFPSRDGIGKSFACIDGCVGVVSVKSKLDSRELIDSLKNIASLPDKQPLRGDQIPGGLVLPHYDDCPWKIVYASDGIELTTLQESLNGFYSKHPEIPYHKRPNLIHVAGKYALSRSRLDSVGPRGNVVKTGDFLGNSDVTDVFGIATAVLNIQVTAMVTKWVLLDYRKMLVNTFQQSTGWQPSPVVVG